MKSSEALPEALVLLPRKLSDLEAQKLRMGAVRISGVMTERGMADVAPAAPDDDDDNDSLDDLEDVLHPELGRAGQSGAAASDDSVAYI